MRAQTFHLYFFWQLNFFSFNFFFAVSGAPYPFLSLSFLIRMLCHLEIFCNLFHTAKYIAHVHPPMDGGLSWAELSRAEMSWVCYGVKQRHCDYFMNTEMISALSNVQSWDCVRRCCFCYYIFCTICVFTFRSPFLFFCHSGKKKHTTEIIFNFCPCVAHGLCTVVIVSDNRIKNAWSFFFSLANNRIRFVAPFNLLLLFFSSLLFLASPRVCESPFPLHDEVWPFLWSVFTHLSHFRIEFSNTYPLADASPSSQVSQLWVEA